MDYTRPLLTCTEELQPWNHPRKRKTQVQLAEEIDWARAKIPSGQAKKRSNMLLCNRRHNSRHSLCRTAAFAVAELSTWT